MLAGGDADGRLTAVAVGVAKLGEPPLVTAHKDASSFIGTGRALSVAAGRISYVHGLKVLRTSYLLQMNIKWFHRQERIDDSILLARRACFATQDSPSPTEISRGLTHFGVGNFLEVALRNPELNQKGQL